MKLAPPKFTIGEHAWAEIVGQIHHVTIVGYEDGRNLSNSSFTDFKGPYKGWVYYVTVYENDEKAIGRRYVPEEKLKKLNDSYIENMRR